MATPSAACLKRLQAEMKIINKLPLDSDFHAAPDESNMLLWFVVIDGGKDTDYEGGSYVFKFIIPAEYPTKPCDFKCITPSGRFEVDHKICTSFSGYHKESWSPVWNISAMASGLQSFMVDTDGALGTITSTSAFKKKCARDSHEYNLKNIPQFSKYFPQRAARARLGKPWPPTPVKKVEAPPPSPATPAPAPPLPVAAATAAVSARSNNNVATAAAAAGGGGGRAAVRRSRTPERNVPQQMNINNNVVAPANAAAAAGPAVVAAENKNPKPTKSEKPQQQQQQQQPQRQDSKKPEMEREVTVIDSSSSDDDDEVQVGNGNNNNHAGQQQQRQNQQQQNQRVHRTNSKIPAGAEFIEIE